MKIIELFGGSITCELPDELHDVSYFRYVPDNQEIYSAPEFGLSIIFELLEKVPISDEECSDFFFREIAELNEAKFPTIEHKISEINISTDSLCYNNIYSIPGFQSPSFITTLDGIQWVSKYKNEIGKENKVLISLGVIRYDYPISTDFVISLNAPQIIHPESSESNVVTSIKNLGEVLLILKHILESFSIQNYSLFHPAC